MKRFLWWLLRNDIRPMHEVGDRVWTGYTTLIVTEQMASVRANANGEEVIITLTLVKPEFLGYAK